MSGTAKLRRWPLILPRGGDLGDERVDILAEKVLDPLGEAGEGCAVVRSVLVVARELEEEPPLRLETLVRLPVVPPALAEVEELVDRGRAAEDEAEGERDPEQRGRDPAADVQADEGGDDDGQNHHHDAESV